MVFYLEAIGVSQIMAWWLAFEKAISILAGNLNSGHSYLITAVQLKHGDKPSCSKSLSILKTCCKWSKELCGIEDSNQRLQILIVRDYFPIFIKMLILYLKGRKLSLF